MKIEYDKNTSLCHFMDQFAIQRMERIIAFESQCTPQNDELIDACYVLIEHYKAVWDIK